jgi:hypothetical protein
MESMLPAMGQTQTKMPTRLACFEMVHGSAGATKIGSDKYLWSPKQAGSDFDLSTTSLLPLEPWKDYLTIVSNTDMRPAEAFELHEVGGDHFRCSAVFLTQAHPKQTEGSDVYCGTSFDQHFAEKYGQDTALPSVQLSIESVDQAGGCDYGYSCVYTDTITWASATKPLPMIRDPRMVFDMLFGHGATDEERAARRASDRSLLDFVMHEATRLKAQVTPRDKARLDDYLENIHEIERRIARIEQHNGSGEQRQLPTAPIGVPDNWEEHVKLMLDLQALAFMGDVTRVTSFKLSRDATGRSFPESGINAGFHGASHHGENEQRIGQFAQINKYHVSMLPYFAEKLKSISEPDGKTLLDHSLILYGSPMGDSNLHNHKRVPLILIGHAGGTIKGKLHVITPDGTPSANMYLALGRKLGLNMDSFGDSTGELSI